MNTNTGGSLSELAAKVREEGLRLMKEYDLAVLREVWRRLPKVAGKPPAGQRAFAERIALYVHELGDTIPKDLKEFIQATEPLREFENPQLPPKATAAEEAKDDAPADGATNGSTSPTATEASTTMHTQTATTTKKGPGSGSKAPPPARKGGKSAAGARSATGHPGRKAAPASSGSHAAKATSKKGPKDAKPGRSSGPRAGSMTELVVKLTKEGKGIEAIAKACAKLKPNSTFATEVADGDYHSVKYYQNIAREKGWLPPAKS